MSNKLPPPALPHCVPPGWALPVRAAPHPALQGPGCLLQSLRILRIFLSSLRMGAVFAGPQHPWFLCPAWPLLLLPEGSGRPPAAPGWGSPPARHRLPEGSWGGARESPRLPLAAWRWRGLRCNNRISRKMRLNGGKRYIRGPGSTALLGIQLSKRRVQHG